MLQRIWTPGLQVAVVWFQILPRSSLWIAIVALGGVVLLALDCKLFLWLLLDFVILI
jgi:hypothetical protein